MTTREFPWAGDRCELGIVKIRATFIFRAVLFRPTNGTTPENIGRKRFRGGSNVICQRNTNATEEVRDVEF